MKCVKCDLYFCWLCDQSLDRKTPYSHFSDSNNGCTIYGKKILTLSEKEAEVSEKERLETCLIWFAAIVIGAPAFIIAGACAIGVTLGLGCLCACCGRMNPKKLFSLTWKLCFYPFCFVFALPWIVLFFIFILFYKIWSCLTSPCVKKTLTPMDDGVLDEDDAKSFETQNKV